MQALIAEEPDYRYSLTCMLEVEAFTNEDGIDGYRFRLHIPNVTWTDESEDAEHLQPVMLVDEVKITKIASELVRDTVYKDVVYTVDFTETQE